MSEFILEMRGITKTFPGVKALDNVNFSVRTGEIHCLVGENGAGKSTLMKVLSGIHAYGSYEGDVVMNGQVMKFHNIRDSERAGIAIINQELALIPELSVAENIFFGRELTKNKLVDWNRTNTEAVEYLDKVRLKVSPKTPIRELRVGSQQLVEIAKALSKNATLLILDEPTSSLNEEDSDNLLNLLRELKAQGVTIIMISHRLKEVVEIADTVTVLRDGATICSMDAAEATEANIIRNMVGRDMDTVYPTRSPDHQIGDVRFEIKNWSVTDPKDGRQILNDINVNVRKGEIIGIAGLMGAGRTELALSVFGNTPGYKLAKTGELVLEGKKVRFRSPKEAIRKGVAYATEDRKRNGLVLIQDVKFNSTVANLGKISTAGVINGNQEIVEATKLKEDINVKTPTIMQMVRNLSGGNQQKVVLSKWIFASPEVLILDEPTRGIDIGAKHEIYTLMNKMVEEGMSIIMISSELLEVIGMSDRIYVMHEGRITGELPASEATEEKIMRMATNTEE